MRFGKILLMGLMAACLMGASSRAWDEGNTICPGDGGAEAEQIRIFIKNWKEVYPMDGEPVRNLRSLTLTAMVFWKSWYVLRKVKTSLLCMK